MAQWVRFAVTAAGMLMAGAAFLWLPVSWGWLVALAIFALGGLLSERLFRRLASPEEIRADLEDRVRHPSD